MNIIRKIVFALSLGLVVVSALLTQSCRKELFTDKGNLTFSTDTLSFDTVFTAQASATRFFKVYNRENRAVKISSIRLLDIQTDAPFRINVDGITGKQFTDVEIPAKDSIYVFVEVTVKNPQNPNNPFVINDIVEFVTNGVTQNVVLDVWGQDAYYHKGEVYGAGQNVVWANDKPHILLNADTFPGAWVDEGATLTIQSGCKIFTENNAGLFVFGTLNAQANSWNDSIVFRGLRLESFYKDKPAQWWGIIYFRNSSGVPAKLNLKRVIVNESFFGVADAYIFNLSFQQNVFGINLGTYNTVGAPELLIENCIVKNAQNTALFALNANLKAENSIFHTTGSNVAALALGGNYEINHCTLYNTGGRYLEHKQEALLISDKIVNWEGNLTFPASLSAQITNSIVWGSLDNEFRFADDADVIRFENCLVKLRQDSVNKYSTKFVNCKVNEEPKFKDAGKENFTPSDSLGSPLIDAGKLIGIGTDIFDKPRNTPDIGAVEGK